MRVNVDEVFGTGRTQQQQEQQQQKQRKNNRQDDKKKTKNKREYTFGGAGSDGDHPEGEPPAKMRRKRPRNLKPNPCKRKHKCIGRALRPRPRAPILSRTVRVKGDSVTLWFSLLSSGTPPSVVYVVEGDVDDMDSFLCHNHTTGEGLPGLRQRAALTVTGLAAGARYSDFSLIACAAPNPPPPWDCHQLNPLECSMQVRVKAFTCTLPRVPGSVNRGTLDGGGWVLVRRQPGALTRTPTLTLNLTLTQTLTLILTITPYSCHSEWPHF